MIRAHTNMNNDELRLTVRQNLNNPDRDQQVAEAESRATRAIKSAYQKGVFLEVCRELRNLRPIDANQSIIAKYFEGVDYNKAMVLICIRDDKQLHDSLSWFNPEAERREEVMHAKHQPPEIIRETLRERSREYLESTRKMPPPELTRQAFKDASADQCAKWLRLYTAQVLNEHWRKLEQQP